MYPSASTASIASRARASGNRLVAQELAGRRVDDGRALVADDRIVDAGLAGVGPHRLEHAPRRDQHANTGGARLRDRLASCARAGEIFGDQRPIEVARDDLDVAREVVGERSAGSGLDDVRGHVGDLLLGELILECGHSAAAVQDLLVRLLGGGCASSRLGPTVPDRSCRGRARGSCRSPPTRTRLRRLRRLPRGPRSRRRCRSGNVPTTVSGVGVTR